MLTNLNYVYTVLSPVNTGDYSRTATVAKFSDKLSPFPTSRQCGQGFKRNV